MDSNALSTLMGVGLIAGFFLLVALALAVGLCYITVKAMAGVPEKHRPMDPNMVWLLLIPLFNFFWNFKVYPPMMEAYRKALAEKNLPVEGDGGYNLALAYCITVVCCIIPLLNVLAALAVLVLWILVLVKAYGFKRQLEA